MWAKGCTPYPYHPTPGWQLRGPLWTPLSSPQSATWLLQHQLLCEGSPSFAPEGWTGGLGVDLTPLQSPRELLQRSSDGGRQGSPTGNPLPTVPRSLTCPLKHLSVHSPASLLNPELGGLPAPPVGPQFLPQAPWPGPGREQQPQSSHAALGAPVRSSPEQFGVGGHQPCLHSPASAAPSGTARGAPPGTLPVFPSQIPLAGSVGVTAGVQAEHRGSESPAPSALLG